METATELFYEQGYNRTGINEILEKSGVAKASMYKHFRSKEEILLEYLKIMERTGDANLARSLAAKPKGEKQILGIFDFVLDFYNQPNYRGCWSQNVISEVPRDDEMILTEIREQKARFKSFVQKKVRENLQVKNPNQLGQRIFLLYEAALVDSQIFGADWPIKEAREMAKLMIRSNK